jgi:hypothetical protein
VAPSIRSVEHLQISFIRDYFDGKISSQSDETEFLVCKRDRYPVESCVTQHGRQDRHYGRRVHN